MLDYIAIAQPVMIYNIFIGLILLDLHNINCEAQILNYHHEGTKHA